VRPFCIIIDGWTHGLVLSGDGPGLEEDDCAGAEDAGEEDAADGPSEHVFLMPFNFPFHPPYDSGLYDT
jgi:hypothetical protein